MAGCFKTYDVRGRVDELNEDLAFRIGVAYGEMIRPNRVAVGRDMRLSSPALSSALIAGLEATGVKTYDLGLCGTECVYFACFDGPLDGGIMITASHNPADYNGMKLVGEAGRPLVPSQLRELERRALEERDWPARAERRAETLDISEGYLDLICRLVPPGSVQPFKVLCDGGDGAAGPWVEKLAARYPQLRLELVRGKPDGNFPHGVPNPLLPENRQFTAEAVRRAGADLGVAWDGDFDRCFLFDHRGEFVDSYYLIGLLAEYFLKAEPGAPILYDPRLTWCTIDRVRARGGQPILSQTGHVFLKDKMRETGAVYGGEMSGHHYFRDFGNCDTGMLPWVVLLRLLSDKQKTLAELVAEAQQAYPISGEINRRVDDADFVLEAARREFSPGSVTGHDLDGVSLEFEDWRFNLRKSNTEPLIRLNVESRGSRELVEQKTELLLDFIENCGKLRLQQR